MKSLSSDERKLVIIQGFYFFAASLAGIFVTIFFFAHGDLKTATLYNIAFFASMTFFYGLSGLTLRYYSSGTLLKLSLVARALFYLLLFFLKENSIMYVIPLGILSGLSGGNFWAAYNLNQYILTHSASRVSYFGWAAAIFHLTSALGPVIGGLIIAFIDRSNLGISNGYLVLFLLVALINVLTVFIIGKLPSHGIPHFSYHHIWQHQHTKNWKLVLGQQGLLGLYDVAIGTVTGILLYVTLKSEAELGYVLTMASIFAMIASLYAIPLLKKYSSAFWVGSVGSAVSIVIFALFQSHIGAWLYIAISGLTTPALNNKLSTVYFHALDGEIGSWQQKYHLLLERDIILGITRTLSFIGLFILLQFGNEIQLAKTWLLFLPILPIAIGFLIQKNIANIDKK
jgi:MFS family permease